LALDDKYDDIKKLIDTGKEKGYLTYDQVNDSSRTMCILPTTWTIC
jgi:Tfp pilus assembly pilus retraction ATPase PilT